MKSAQIVDPTEPSADTVTPDALRSIEERVLWLSTAIIHHANRVRPNRPG